MNNYYILFLFLFSVIILINNSIKLLINITHKYRNKYSYSIY